MKYIALIVGSLPLVAVASNNFRAQRRQPPLKYESRQLAQNCQFYPNCVQQSAQLFLHNNSTRNYMIIECPEGRVQVDLDFCQSRNYNINSDSNGINICCL